MRRILAAIALVLAGCANPAPPPPAAPEPEIHVVFFQTDSAALTPEARQVVGTTALSAMDRGNAKVVVEGRADGGTPHDAQLADQRAMVIIAALVAGGVDAARIEKKPSAPPAGITGVAAHQVVVQLMP